MPTKSFGHYHKKLYFCYKDNNFVKVLGINAIPLYFRLYDKILDHLQFIKIY